MSDDILGVKVDNCYVDATTGHHTYHIRAIERVGKETFLGPIKTIGIDAQALIDLHGNDPEKFILSHKESVIKLHQAVRETVDKVHNMKGKIL